MNELTPRPDKPVSDAAQLSGSPTTSPPDRLSTRPPGQTPHDAAARMADNPTPQSGRRDAGAPGAESDATLHETTEQHGVSGDPWTEVVRSRVRRHPLACLAAAVALGALMLRAAR